MCLWEVGMLMLMWEVGVWIWEVGVCMWKVGVQMSGQYVVVHAVDSQEVCSPSGGAIGNYKNKT